MSPKLMTIGSLCFIGTLASTGDPAQADRISTHGAICQNYNAGQVLDIDYLTSGVQNINGNPRPVICAVPRSPANGTFYVDGSNTGGTATTCTASLFNLVGTFRGSTTFTRTGTWDQAVTFPGLVVGTFDYVSVLCTLPGNGRGIIHGVSAP